MGKESLIIHLDWNVDLTTVRLCESLHHSIPNLFLCEYSSALSIVNQSHNCDDDDDEFPICQMGQVGSRNIPSQNPDSSNCRHYLHSWHEKSTFFLPCPAPDVRPLFSSPVLGLFSLFSLKLGKKSETSFCILFLLLKQKGGRGMIHVLYLVLFRIVGKSV